MKTRALFAALLLVPATACRDTENGPLKPNQDAGVVDGGPIVIEPGLACPASEALTVCDLRLDSGERQPPFGDPVEIPGVVVSSPVYSILENSTTGQTTLAGFFVQDQMTTDELAWRFSGVLVTFRPSDVPNPPNVGDVVKVTGTYKEFGREGFVKQKQIEASFVEASGATAAVQPVMIDNAASLVGGSLAYALEGVLVQVRDVTAVVVRDVPGVGTNKIFGAFQLAGGLVVSGEIFQYRVELNEEFNSITGVLRVGTAPFDAGIFMLSPRSPADVASKNPLLTIESIATLQDPNAAGRPPICVNSGTLMGRCPRVDLRNVVVTAARGYVSANLRAFYVQDERVADGRYAGVKVVYSNNHTGYIPEVGHRVNVAGEAIIYFGGMQVQFSEFSRVGTDTANIAPTVVSPGTIARTELETNPYEGVLVRIEDVEVLERCIDSNNRDFGNFVVTGPVFLGSAWDYTYAGRTPSTASCMTMNCSCAGNSRQGDMRTLGQRFDSITGVMSYGFNEFRLEPRSAADLDFAQ